MKGLRPPQLFVKNDGEVIEEHTVSMDNLMLL
jgi:hypothetical protein